MYPMRASRTAQLLPLGGDDIPICPHDQESRSCQRGLSVPLNLSLLQLAVAADCFQLLGGCMACRTIPRDSKERSGEQTKKRKNQVPAFWLVFWTLAFPF